MSSASLPEHHHPGAYVRLLLRSLVAAEEVLDARVKACLAFLSCLLCTTRHCVISKPQGGLDSLPLSQASALLFWSHSVTTCKCARELSPFVQLREPKSTDPKSPLLQGVPKDRSEPASEWLGGINANENNPVW